MPHLSPQTAQYQLEQQAWCREYSPLVLELVILNKGCCKLKRRVFISVTCRKRYTHVKRYMYSFRHQLGQLGKSLPDSCNYDFKMKRKKYCMGRYCRVQVQHWHIAVTQLPTLPDFPLVRFWHIRFFFLACLTISGVKTLYGPRLTQGLKTRGKKTRPISSPIVGTSLHWVKKRSITWHKENHLLAGNSG